mgnify:CR=1 FL=1
MSHTRANRRRRRAARCRPRRRSSRGRRRWRRSRSRARRTAPCRWCRRSRRRSPPDRPRGASGRLRRRYWVGARPARGRSTIGVSAGEERAQALVERAAPVVRRVRAGTQHGGRTRRRAASGLVVGRTHDHELRQAALCRAATSESTPVARQQRRGTRHGRRRSPARRRRSRRRRDTRWRRRRRPRAFRRGTALGDAGETDALVRKERDAVATLPDGRAHARDERRLLLVRLGAGRCSRGTCRRRPWSSQEAADEARDALGGVLAGGRPRIGRSPRRAPSGTGAPRRLRAHTGLGLGTRAHESGAPIVAATMIDGQRRLARADRGGSGAEAPDRTPGRGAVSTVGSVG